MPSRFLHKQGTFGNSAKCRTALYRNSRRSGQKSSELLLIIGSINHRSNAVTEKSKDRVEKWDLTGPIYIKMDLMS